MPLKLEIEALEAEVAALKVLHTESKEVNDRVGIIQYAGRIKEIEEELKSLRETVTPNASIALFFGGSPVFGSRGIEADFAGKMLENFQEILSKQFATNELGLIGERGKVPFKHLASLMVTGLTQGSFGFVLDELRDQKNMFDTTLKDVVGDVIKLVQSISSIDESLFEKAVETLDSRTLEAVKKFFVNLDSNTATVRMVDDINDFTLDEEAITRARVRAETTQIDEEVDKEYNGILKGLMPDHLRFEFVLEGGETISGSITKEAVVQLEKEPFFIPKKCTIKVKERLVKPLNRSPRMVYRIIEFASLK